MRVDIVHNTALYVEVVHNAGSTSPNKQTDRHVLSPCYAVNKYHTRVVSDNENRKTIRLQVDDVPLPNATHF